MLNWLFAKLLTKLFGDGFGAELAGRGTAYLAGEVRKSLAADDEDLTRIRLRPGQSYTVIARPPATRRETRLASRQRTLEQRYDKATRPSRRQYRAARRLERTQRKLDRRTEGTRRHARLLAKEQRRGRHFDKVTRPSKKTAELATALEKATAQLDAERARTYDAARTKRRRVRRRDRVKVYD